MGAGYVIAVRPVTVVGAGLIWLCVLDGLGVSGVFAPEDLFDPGCFCLDSPGPRKGPARGPRYGKPLSGHGASRRRG